MTPYEIGSLITAIVAVLIAIAIPLVQYAYRKYQKPKLEIMPFDVKPLSLYFDSFGPYVGFRFSILCENQACVVKSIGLRVKRLGDKGWIYTSKWLSLKPIHANWMYAGNQQASISSSTLVHPIRIEAGKLEPMNVEFAAQGGEKHRLLIGEVCKAVDIACDAVSSVDELLAAPQVQTAVLILGESCAWSRGGYIAELRVRYDAAGEVLRRFSFSVNADEARLLRDNATTIATLRAPADLAGSKRQIQSVLLEVDTA